MANNVLIPGAGVATAATDQLAGGEHVQLIKLMDGAEDSAARIGGDAANGLDVDVTRVSGTVTVTGPLTDTQLRASAVPVSGPLTDTQLRATPVPVSGTVSVSGTTTVQDNSSQVDDAAFTPATGRVTMVGATFDDVAPDSVDEGDGGAIRMSANRNLYVRLRDNAGNERGLNIDASGRALVDASGVAVPVTDNAGSLTVDNGGTFAVQDSEKVVDNAGFTDGTTKVLPAGFIFDEVAGTALTENDAAAGRIDSKRAQVLVIEDATTRGQRAAVSAGGAVKVDASTVAVPVTDNAGSLTVDNAGTFAVQDSEKVADNAAFTDGTTKVLPAGFIFDEVAGTALTENDAAAARVDSKRAQVLVLEDATTRGQRATVSAGGAVKVDGSAVTQPTKETRSATGTQSIVASTVTTNTSILASNANRLGAAIYNDSTASLFLLVGAGTESATVFTTKIAPAGYYEVPFNYTGIIAGHWSAANGSARITEWT